MEWRRSAGDVAYCRLMYRHTKQIGYKVPCPNRAPAGSCCVLCRDTGQIGFFRAERMMKKSKGEKS